MTSRYRLIFATVLLTAVAAVESADITTVPVSVVAKWSGHDSSRLVLPTDVAIGKSGLLYVVDSGNDRVVVSDKHGNWSRTFGTSGNGDGELDGPVGIDVDASGDVYIADRRNQRLQVFSSDGEYLRSLPLEAGGEDVVPVDVAVSDDSSELFVTSANLHSVLVYSTDGSLLRQWGVRGDKGGEFFHPATIAISNNKVFIVDVLNSRVQVFSSTGEPVAEFGKLGAGPGTLFRPKGIAIDEQHRIFVSDSYLGVIQVFNDEYEFAYALGSEGSPKRFENPAGMASVGNELIVVQMLAGSIEVLSLEPGP